MKMKSNLTLFISFLMLILFSTALFMFSSTKVYADISESGSKENPILINNEKELLYYVNLINSSEDNKYNEKYYKLTNDIILSKASVVEEVATDKFWKSIGTESKPFKGNFNGNGYSIKNLRLNYTEEELIKYPFLGLFGKCENAEIYRLGIEIEENYLLKNDYDITNIEDSSNYLLLTELGKTLKTSNEIEQIYIGGIAGYVIETNIESCYVKYNNFSICTNSNAYVGGIVGYADSSTIKNCYAYADNETNLISTNLSVENISSYASVCSIGGICGFTNNLIMTNCYSNLNIEAINNKSRLSTATSEFMFEGGLIGYVEGINTYISNCFTLKNVTGYSNDGVLNKGSIIGFISFSGYNIPIKNNINYLYSNSNQLINNDTSINLIGQTCIYELSETCKKLNNSELLAYETFKNINFNPYNNWDNNVIWTKSISVYDHLKLQCFKSYDFSVKVNSNQLYGEYEIYINGQKQNSNGSFNLKAGNEINIIPISYEHYKFSFYQFNGLTISDSSIFDINENQLTFTLGEQTAGNIEIFFSPIQYPITIKNDSNGKVKVDSALIKEEEAVIYRSYNSIVTVTAEANVGFILKNWTNENNKILDNKKEYSFVVNGPTTIMANFTSNVYYIDAFFNEGGNLFINDEKVTENGKLMVNKNSEVKIKVEPYKGYKFIGIYNGEQLITEKNEYTFTIKNDISIEPKFEIVKEQKSKVNWGLILGITGGAIGGAGLLTLFIILAVRKRKMRNMFRF